MDGTNWKFMPPCPLSLIKLGSEVGMHFIFAFIALSQNFYEEKLLSMFKGYKKLQNAYGPSDPRYGALRTALKFQWIKNIPNKNCQVGFGSNKNPQCLFLRSCQFGSTRTAGIFKY